MHFEHSTLIQAEINAIHQDTAQIDDSAGRAIVKRLLNLVERLAGAGTSPLSLAQFALVSSMFKVFFCEACAQALMKA